MAKDNNTKYRLGIFQDGNIALAGRDFLMNDQGNIGQYISSNWFKEQLFPNEILRLFIIRYNKMSDIIPILHHVMVDDQHIIDYSRDSPFIIGTFNIIINNNLLFEEINSIKHITYENIHADQPKTFIELSLIKDNSNRMFVYCPCIHI
jgi:hypothetical protein